MSVTLSLRLEVREVKKLNGARSLILLSHSDMLIFERLAALVVTLSSGHLLIIPAPADPSLLALQLGLADLGLLLLPVLARPLLTHHILLEFQL